MTLLALACAAGGGAGTGAAFGQGAAPPRAVQVTPAPASPDTAPPAPKPAPTPAGPADDVAPAPEPPPAPRSPADEQQRVVELYRAHFGGQLTKAPYLGVSTSAVPAALRQHLALPEGVGLVVDFVEPDSPAAAAGLKQYDIITRFNDQILVNAQQLAVLVRAQKAGAEVKLSVIRAAKDQTLTVKLIEKEVKPLGDLFEGFALVEGEAARAANLAERAEHDRRAADVRRRMAERRIQNGAAALTADESAAARRPGERTLSVWRDNDMTLHLNRRRDGRHHLVVTDKSGKVVFDGDPDDEKDRANLPREVDAKLKQMQAKVSPPGADTTGHGPDARPRGEAHGEPRFDGGDVATVKGFEFEASHDQDDRGDDDADDGDNNENENPDAGPRAGGPVKGPIANNDVLSIAINDVHGRGVKTVKTARVRDGQVHLPYVEPIACVGLTEADLEKQITAAYARAKVAPNVDVKVRKVTPAEERKKH